jgi:broad specificity phosphatase PhoE
MTIYLLRHADKEKGDYRTPSLKHQDPPITLRGKAQAGKLVSYFQPRVIEAIYTSEYQRTWQTAEPLANQLRITPVIDARLNEIDNGVLEGMDDEVVKRRYPETWKAYQDRGYDFRLPGGETGEEALARILSFMSDRCRTNKNTLIVTHEALIRILFCHVAGLPVYKRFGFRVDYCGFMELEYAPEQEKWLLVRFNQVI